mgnify:CR=1 FL=1
MHTSAQVWPGSQLLSEYLVSNAATMANYRSVCEVGAGTGMAGLVCAMLATAHSRELVLTDGAAEACGLMQHNLDLNEGCVPDSVRVKVARLRWGEEERERDLAKLPGPAGYFDAVLASDCALSSSTVGDFVRTVNRLLRADAGATFICVAIMGGAAAFDGVLEECSSCGLRLIEPANGPPSEPTSTTARRVVLRFQRQTSAEENRQTEI